MVATSLSAAAATTKSLPSSLLRSNLFNSSLRLAQTRPRINPIVSAGTAIEDSAFSGRARVRPAPVGARLPSHHRRHRHPSRPRLTPMFAGDVLLHCVVDAILGALKLPDIGQIFPDNDPKWCGAASSVFIKEAVKLMHEAGYEIGNLDATLILQRPKFSPHKEVMRANLGNLLGVDPSVVNLKAKTYEKVNSLGENRSIAAHAVVLLMKK